MIGLLKPTKQAFTAELVEVTVELPGIEPRSKGKCTVFEFYLHGCLQGQSSGKASYHARICVSRRSLSAWVLQGGCHVVKVGWVQGGQLLGNLSEPWGALVTVTEDRGLLGYLPRLNYYLYNLLRRSFKDFDQAFEGVRYIPAVAGSS